MLTDELKKLMREYIDDFTTKKNDLTLRHYIIEDSFPIVWFGNLERYKHSQIKILTLGLNPSWHEFWKNNCGIKELRFLKVPNLKLEQDIDFFEFIAQSLCEYFDNNPYRQYFSSFEKALINLLGASYGGKIIGLPADNIAIHADIFSAIATNALWSDIREDQAKIKRVDLFQKLLDYLSPNVMMVSIGKDYHDAWKVLGVNPYSDKDLLEGKYNGEIEAYKANNRIVIYGRNRQRPFAVDNNILEEASYKIIEEVYGENA